MLCCKPGIGWRLRSSACEGLSCTGTDATARALAVRRHGPYVECDCSTSQLNQRTSQPSSAWHDLTASRPHGLMELTELAARKLHPHSAPVTNADEGRNRGCAHACSPCHKAFGRPVSATASSLSGDRLCASKVGLARARGLAWKHIAIHSIFQDKWKAWA